MALIKTWKDLGTGLVLPDAYHRVVSVVVDLERKQAQFSVCVYRDLDARVAGLQPFMFATRVFTVRNIPAEESSDGEAHLDFDTYFSLAALEAQTNPVRQAYLWLKDQPLYKDALDA